LGNCGAVRNINSKFNIWSHSAEIVGDEITFKYLISEITPLDYLTTFLDKVIESYGYTSWVEKSPTHYQSTQKILDQSVHNWVVFIARNGLDVVASIRDRAIKNPDHFSNQHRVEYGIGLWNDSVRVAHNNLKNKRLLIVNYEIFCEHPELVINKIKTRIGLDFKFDNKNKIETIGKGEK
jgi:hypothetical protein